MSIEATVKELIDAINRSTEATNRNTEARLAVVAEVNKQTKPQPVKEPPKSTPAADLAPPPPKQTPLAEQVKGPTYEEVAQVFNKVYANGAGKDAAMRAIAPLLSLRIIKESGEQFTGQLAELKAKLTAALEAKSATDPVAGGLV